MSTVTRSVEPGVAHPLHGVVVLLARDRGGDHAAAAGGGGVDGEPAPARADLQDVVVGAELEPLADALELGHRRLLQRHPRPLEQGAGVHHRRVEHPLEQLVAEVVMGGDVAPAALAGAAVERRAHALARRPQRRRDRADAVDDHRVARRQADDRHQVGRVPQPLRVGLRQPPAAAHEHPPEARVVGVDRGGRGPGAERPAPSPSTMMRLPTRIWRSSSDATSRQEAAWSLSPEVVIAPRLSDGDGRGRRPA